MKISIMGPNGFLSTAIAKYANKEHWALDMYGLDTPVRHKYDNFYKMNLMDTEMDCSGLMDSDIVIYAIGAGIQANLQEDFNLIYNLNVTAPVNICNKLKELDYKGFRHWHFYIPTIYGAGENPKRLIPYVINAIRNGEELHFTAGEQTRQYVHVNDVPRLLAMAFEKGLPSGLYNIEGKETLTVKEIVTLIHQAMGKQVPEGCFGSVQRADVGMKYLALDGKKLKNTIGFEATVKITDTIDLY